MKQGGRNYEHCYISEVSNKEHARTVTSLEDVSWYHGDITRHVAETLLLGNGIEGTYLLRLSKKQSGYAVSVRCHDSIRHYVVQHDKVADIYVFGVATFYSLQELLDHFASIPVVSNETDVPVVLRHPYHKNVNEPHSYSDVSRHGEIGKDVNLGSESMPDLSVATKEGFLVKRGGIHKNWKKRWFAIQKSELKYFDNRKSLKPIKSLDLKEAIEVAEDYCDNRKNCFRLRFPTRTYYLVAETPADVKSWIDFFQWKIDYYNNGAS